MAETSPGRSARPNRPLSPHLQIYTPLINMVMSILHRLTGAALYFGTILLARQVSRIIAAPASSNMLARIAAAAMGLCSVWILMA